MPTTIRDVARSANVAPSLVSRVLNADPTLRIRPDTEARIRAAIEKLQYIPNQAGRALRSTKASAIGLILPDVTNPVFSESIRGTVTEAAEQGYVVLLSRTDDFGTQANSYSRLVGERRIDGVLLQVSNVLASKAMAELIDRRVPTVLVNSRLEKVPGSVCINDEHVAYLATKHLVDLGHCDIGTLAGPRFLYMYRQRQRGFQKALGEAGIDLRREWVVYGSYDVDSGEAAMRKLLAANSTGKLPSAIFVTTIAAAVGALRVAREASLRVPEDLSIVSVHDFWFAEHTSPPLTTVRTPQFALGVEAMRAVAERINGAEPTELIVDDPPAELIVRSSTAPPRTD